MLIEKRKKNNKREIYFAGKRIFSYTSKRKVLKNLERKCIKLEEELKYIKLWQTDFFKDIPENFPLVMSKKEQKLLLDNIKGSKNHIEFGAGGSTFLTLLNSNTTIYSIESDENWINYLRSWKFINNKEQENKIHFKFINIGKTGEWGFPIDKNQEKNYPNYSSEIFEQIKNKPIDTIFIDGRFRVACTLSSILNYPNATIMIHDYTIRDEYHIVEEFLDIIETADTLTVFKLKTNCNLSKVKKLYEEYKNNPQ